MIKGPIFDDSVRVTTQKLTRLEDLKTFAEKEMALGSHLNVEAGSGPHRKAA